MIRRLIEASDSLNKSQQLDMSRISTGVQKKVLLRHTKSDINCLVLAGRAVDATFYAHTRVNDGFDWGNLLCWPAQWFCIVHLSTMVLHTALSGCIYLEARCVAISYVSALHLCWDVLSRPEYSANRVDYISVKVSVQLYH